MRSWFGAIAVAVTVMAWAVPAGATIRFESYLMELNSLQNMPVLADYNRDGRADLVGGSKLALSRADGSVDNPFSWTTNLGSQYVVAGGLLGGDASADLLTYETPTADQCVVRRYDGDGNGGIAGTPSYTSFGSGTCAEHFVLTDLDNDGVKEFLTLVSQSSGKRYWWSAHYGFIELVDSTGSLLGVAAADVDGDKRQDLLALTSDGTVHQVLRTATGWAAKTTFAAVPGAVAIAAGDVTGDQKADVLTASATTVGMRASSYAIANYTVPGGGVSGLSLGDIDGDGWLEQLLAITQNTGPIQKGLMVRVNRGSGSYATPVTFPGGGFFSKIATATDAAGRIDAIATSSRFSSGAMLFINRSTATAAFAASGIFAQTTVGEESAPQELLLRNTGDALLTVERAFLAGLDADSFQLVADGCQGAVLKRNQTCSVTVRFLPRSAGAKSAALRALHDGEGANAQTSLGGNGLAPAAAATATRAADSPALQPAPAPSTPTVVAGPQGPKGDQGVAGRDGRDGRDGTLQCSGSGGVCTIALAATPGVVSVQGELRLKGRVVARGRARNGKRLRLVAHRRLRPGRYQLRLVRVGEGGSRTVIRRSVRIR